MSITATASQIVLDALLSRLNSGSVFTAYDITQDARDLTNERIDHPEVQRIVHTEFDNGEFPADYHREDQLELNTGHIAICYYPDGSNAVDHPMAMYSPVSSTPATPATPPAPTPTPTTPKQGGSVKDGNGYICSETAKGVINIPDIIVKSATPYGGEYDISISGGNIICKVPDGEGRLRIASSKLGGGPTFRIEVRNKTIVVEKL